MGNPALPYNLTFEASYPTPYATSQFLSMILLSMMGQKHTPNTTTEIKDSYDYVIVGGGSAGSVLAARLAEKECVTVLLLEAGKSPPKVTDIPTTARSFIQSDIDWNYSTAPQAHTGAGLVNRSVAWPSGKTVGGSSVINAMLNLRGNKKNYDDWAAHGAHGWSYDEVLRYFKKLEDNTDAEYVKNGYHGTGGPVTVSKPPYESELKSAVLEAAENKGYRIGDINGPDATGFYDLQATIRDGQRCSAAKAYLAPNDHKENLDIVSGAFVKKIIIDNSFAKGVVYDFEGKTRTVRAYKEVILSAGTVNTAQLLMLSGIGPRQELEKHHIRVKADLPVGKNMQDHWAAMLAFELSDDITPIQKKQVDESNIKQYISSKTGVLSSVQGVAVLAFLDKDDPKGKKDYPDYQLYFWEGATGPAKYQLRVKPEYFEAIYGPYKEKPFYWCLSQVLHPKSKGEVTLRSSNPYDPPIIDPKYFSHPRDMEVIVAGLKKCKEFGQSEALRNIGSKLFTTVYPGCEDVVNDDDKYFRCMARSIVITLNHQTGTARMGNPRDPTTVVDPKLRVKRIRNLRVVDASVMPIIPGGNTNVPTMMVAEKAADMIKETIRCESDNDMHSIFLEE
ncbi:glucose dehydrogenase [Trichonephila clavata]|uniref:Glucose dehydrogenase n=1 Tax=Trichonephila clavata TaxID=2740835 RepID=A0A8X6KR46_TRICU|nr:glucose dehydrogenase [Trichonephila clavata]